LRWRSKQSRSCTPCELQIWEKQAARASRRQSLKLYEAGNEGETWHQLCQFLPSSRLRRPSRAHFVVVNDIGRFPSRRLRLEAHLGARLPSVTRRGAPPARLATSSFFATCALRLAEARVRRDQARHQRMTFHRGAGGVRGAGVAATTSLRSTSSHPLHRSSPTVCARMWTIIIRISEIDDLIRVLVGLNAVATLSRHSGVVIQEYGGTIDENRKSSSLRVPSCI
jgi:hypothetical protein